jgi:hypothetical protein
MKIHRQPVGGDAHRFQKLLTQDFSRMDTPSGLAVVLDTHIFPPQAKSPALQAGLLELTERCPSSLG